MLADIIIKNGTLYGVPDKTSVVIKDGKIIATCTDDQAAEWEGPVTNVIDVCGNGVYPAFIDSHVHPSLAGSLYEYNAAYLYDDIREDNEDRDAYIDRVFTKVKEYAQAHPERTIIRGSGWYPIAFTSDPEGCPTRHDLDKYVSDRPVMLKSFDCHQILVNTCALEAAGVDENTPTPRHGEMGRDENGFPTGLFGEMPGIDFITEAVPGGDYSVEEWKKSLIDFQNDYAFPNGITTVFDALTTANTLQAYAQLVNDADFKLKVNTCLYADPRKGKEQFYEMVEQKGMYNISDRLRVETVKFFIDGGAMGMLAVEPFEAELLEMSGLPADYVGESMWTQEELNEAFLIVSEAGYQIHVHTIGDGAVKMALNGFEFVKNHGIKGNRNVVTHLQNVKEEDIIRMKELDVIAAVQPAWACNDSFVDMGMIPVTGKERSYNSYPYGRIADAGVHVTCSSDFPVSPVMSPLQGIMTGSTRILSKFSPEYDVFKDNPLGPENNPTIDCMKISAVIDGYTSAGAYQLFREESQGKLEAGMIADIVVLSGVIGEDNIKDIEDFSISTLIVDGELWQKN